jgi:putative nucleotidyltransferase-like protein
MPASINIGAGTRLLLRLLRGLNEPGHRADFELNWQSFLEACDYHQVSPIVFHRFQGHRELLPEVLEHLRTKFYRISAYNHYLAKHLLQLVSEFGRQRIPCLALKGPAVAMAAYGDLSLRQYEDIDIMVHVEDVSKAVEILFSRGFHPIRGHSERYKNVQLYHEVTLAAPDGSYAVDLHWQLAPPYARVFGPDARAVWLRAASVHLPFGDVPVLSREDQFLALCQHGTRHRWRQLKWLFDVAELLRNSETMDWSGVEDIIKIAPMARAPASLAALLAHELLGIRVPPELAKILEPAKRTRAVGRAIRDEFLERGQTNGSSHDTLLGLEQHPLVRVKYLAIEALRYPVREILFTITDKDSQFVRLPAKLRLLYYFIRPLRLMLQHGRSAARRIWSMAR